MKKKFRSRIVAALVAVTALTCCFVGSTFAKYVSSADKTATAQVAHWEITNISENGGKKNNFTMTAEKLSPTCTEGETVNSLSSSELVITNNSDVDAKISWTTANGIVVSYNNDADKAKWVDANYNNMTLTAAEDAVFTYTITGTNDTANVAAGTTEVTVGAGKTLKLVLTLNWNTQPTKGNEIDTFFGMYAKQLDVSFAFTATQASELPA